MDEHAEEKKSAAVLLSFIILKLYVAQSGRANVISIQIPDKVPSPEGWILLGYVMNASHNKKKIHNMSILVYDARDISYQSIVHAKNSPN